MSCPLLVIKSVESGEVCPPERTLWESTESLLEASCAWHENVGFGQLCKCGWQLCESQSELRTLHREEDELDGQFWTSEITVHLLLQNRQSTSFVMYDDCSMTLTESFLCGRKRSMKHDVWFTSANHHRSIMTLWSVGQTLFVIQTCCRESLTSFKTV